MIYLRSSLCFFWLQDTTELLREFATSGIGWMEWVFEVIIYRMFTGPIKYCSIGLSPISLRLFRLANPESDVHTIFFRTIYSYASDEFSCLLIEDKILKQLSISNILLYSCQPDNFFFITRQERSHPEVFICFAKLLLEFTDIHSSIERKWNKYASISFDARSREIEMRIAEEGHIG